jgi:hypothetical protein
MSGEPAYLAIQLSPAVSQKLYHPMTCLMVQILPFCVQPYMPSHPMTCLMVQIPPFYVQPYMPSHQMQVEQSFVKVLYHDHRSAVHARREAPYSMHFQLSLCDFDSWTG